MLGIWDFGVAGEREAHSSVFGRLVVIKLSSFPFSQPSGGGFVPA